MSHFSETIVYGTSGRVGSRSDLFSRPSPLQLAGEKNGVARVSRFELGSTTIGNVESTGHVVDVDEPSGITLVAPLRGRLVAESRSEILTAMEGEVLLFSPNRRRTRVEARAGRFHGVPIIVPARTLEDRVQQIGAKMRTRNALRDFSVKLPAHHALSGSELFQMMRLLHSEIDRGAPTLLREGVRSSWGLLLMEALLEALTSAAIVALPVETDFKGSRRIAMEARDYMLTHYSEIATIADVAKKFDVSLRSLQYAFRMVWEVTPNEALNAIRLDAARSLLKRSDSSANVTDAAYAAGFTHLGRFSAAYRARFGELPSRTLRYRR